jgi:tRNA (guanine-N7-)-methyltransferase
VYVNFPDPWFKTRHRNRRVLDPALASDLAGVLRPGGELFFQSDVFDLSLDAMSVLEDEPRLANVFGPWSFTKQDNPYGTRTTREERVLEDGKPVWRMLYERTPVLSGPPARGPRAP